MQDRERAERLHREAIVIDGHNDLPWRLREKFGGDLARFDLGTRHDDGHTDIPRLREGGVKAQFFAAYVPPDYAGDGKAVKATLEQIDLIHRMVASYPDLEMAYVAADIRRIAAAGRIAALIAVEGGHTIESSLAVLRMYRALGARYMTLTHSDNTDWADSATEAPVHGGLTDFGEEVVREMNRLGMLVDISHVSAETMADVLRISRAPIIASHSGARAVNAHARNVPDEILRSVPGNGGVIMVNFYSGFVVPEAAEIVRDMFDVSRELRRRQATEAEYEEAWERWKAEHPVPPGTVAYVVDHIDHIVKVAGIDHVGLGSDYDGVSLVPRGLEDVSTFPAITAELLGRGYSEQDVRKVLGENLLRVMAEAEEFAARVA